MNAVDQIIDLFEQNGDSEYGGEAVTQLQHALQAATLAEIEGASFLLISAALLHDIGHLLHDLPEDAPEEGIDDHHENAGKHFLRKNFPVEVTEPVHLHVAAKRYLCAVDPDYQNRLSRPSVVSQNLQGGPMTREEVNDFESNPFSQDALRLRKWDDLAKDPNFETPSLVHFQKHLKLAAS